MRHIPCIMTFLEWTDVNILLLVFTLQKTESASHSGKIFTFIMILFLIIFLYLLRISTCKNPEYWSYPSSCQQMPTSNLKHSSKKSQMAKSGGTGLLAQHPGRLTQENQKFKTNRDNLIKPYQEKTKRNKW